MSAATVVRRRTGERNPVSGVWQWDGYLDGTFGPVPTPSEREIPLALNEEFPPIRSARKACWWKLVRRA